MKKNVSSYNNGVIFALKKLYKAAKCPGPDNLDLKIQTFWLNII